MAWQQAFQGGGESWFADSNSLVDGEFSSSAFSGGGPGGKGPMPPKRVGPAPAGAKPGRPASAPPPKKPASGPVQKQGNPAGANKPAAGPAQKQGNPAGANKPAAGPSAPTSCIVSTRTAGAALEGDVNEVMRKITMMRKLLNFTYFEKIDDDQRRAHASKFSVASANLGRALDNLSSVKGTIGVLHQGHLLDLVKPADCAAIQQQQRLVDAQHDIVNEKAFGGPALQIIFKVEDDKSPYRNCIAKADEYIANLKDALSKITSTVKSQEALYAVQMLKKVGPELLFDRRHYIGTPDENWGKHCSSPFFVMKGAEYCKMNVIGGPETYVPLHPSDLKYLAMTEKRMMSSDLFQANVHQFFVYLQQKQSLAENENVRATIIGYNKGWMWTALVAVHFIHEYYESVHGKLKDGEASVVVAGMTGMHHEAWTNTHKLCKHFLNMIAPGFASPLAELKISSKQVSSSQVTFKTYPIGAFVKYVAYAHLSVRSEILRRLINPAAPLAVTVLPRTLIFVELAVYFLCKAYMGFVSEVETS